MGLQRRLARDIALGRGERRTREDDQFDLQVAQTENARLTQIETTLHNRGSLALQALTTLHPEATGAVDVKKSAANFLAALFDAGAVQATAFPLVAGDEDPAEAKTSPEPKPYTTTRGIDTHALDSVGGGLPGRHGSLVEVEGD